MAEHEAGSIVIGIVDDDDNLREAMEGWLRSVGYAVHTYASAEDYLWSGANRKHACLILDIQMSGMDGLELQAELNSEGGAPPVIFFTSRDQPHLLERAMAAGAIGFLTKPLVQDQLLELLRNATGKNFEYLAT